jgi:hypothetical protein
MAILKDLRPDRAVSFPTSIRIRRAVAPEFSLRLEDGTVGKGKWHKSFDIYQGIT